MVSSIKKIAVIGLGRVGLPFAITLHEAGFSVVGIDTNEKLISELSKVGPFPFHEPGFQLPEISNSWKVTNNFNNINDVDAFIVTVGTPLDSNLTPSLGPIKNVIKSISEKLTDGTLLIFRSTLGLGVSEAIYKYLIHEGACKNGKPNLAYCPERLAEGKARKELSSLPQIISAERDLSYELCCSVFEKFVPRVHRVSYRQAELIKLMCNTSRYMSFAVSNWVFEFILDQGIDPHTLIKTANDGYPRPIPDRSGFTAGTCLRKDYGLLVQDQSIGDYAIAAWRVNERQPLTLMQAAQRHADLKKSKVAILGVGFKKDVDDLRDSLSLKLAENLQPNCAEVFFEDNFVKADSIELGLTPLKKADMRRVEAEADVLIIGANHTYYETLAENIMTWNRSRRRVIIDVWNISGFEEAITILEVENE